MAKISGKYETIFIVNPTLEEAAATAVADTVKSLVEESGKLEGKELEQLRAALEKAQMLSEIEDLYRPYRPKRRTRASAARERGLEGLARFLKEQRPGGDLQREAAKYVDPDKEVPDTAAAIAGAGDILAEELSDSARLRGQLREYLQKNAQISTTTGTKENEIYQMYSEYSESIRKIPSHRVLAIDRGEREEALKVNVEADTSTVCRWWSGSWSAKTPPLQRSCGRCARTALSG